MPGGLGAVGEAGDLLALFQHLRQIDPHQVVLEAEAGGDGPRHLHIRTGVGPHGDQMGFDPLPQQGGEDHPRIESPREGEVGRFSRQAAHLFIEGRHGPIRIARAAAQTIDGSAAVDLDLTAAEAEHAAGGHAADVGMEGGVAGEVLQLAEVAQGLPVPPPGQLGLAQDVHETAAVGEPAGGPAGQRVVVVHRPHRGGDDRAALGALVHQGVFAAQVT